MRAPLWPHSLCVACSAFPTATSRCSPVARCLEPGVPCHDARQIAAAASGITELQSYVDELTTRRSKAPRPDLITALLASEADGERLTHDETVAMIANLLVAGHDTAGSQIPCSILLALQHRDELIGVHEDQARLATAVAETMRLEPIFRLFPARLWSRLVVRQYDSGWHGLPLLRFRVPRCVGMARTR